ncbi:uncharacterized protein DDB_G0283697-like [Maniola hyperantus]|uniref:uncharacterized protein DDB_G0283697-like n=1 Tax=Aphantopus hyperantus TaxID=2795564 RepID=UPI001568B879|nr:biorientation of chromosomes in cell division protein 1-like 1 [Maniola hyperantus]
MTHLQYMPGDPRLVDQLVYELKSKGIFDQFRKDCIADVDTRPAYQNLRQRVENSVTTFLSRQTWQPDMNKNQLREKLRKHILDGNYLEQGVERIVDQVVNPKVATVFIPKVEDLVYTVLGITRKKSPPAETSNEKADLLPNDLEAVSPGSVKSNDEKNEKMDVDSIQDNRMEIDEEKSRIDTKENSIVFEIDKENTGDIQLPNNDQNDDMDKSNIPLPLEEIKPENIPSPDTSPPKVELEKIELPKELIISTDIPLPNDICKEEKDQYFKPVNSEDDDSSSGSSLRRNMSPLTPIRNFNNENSCDAQQAFENDSTDKSEDKKEPSSFRFKLDAKSSENSSDAIKPEKKETEINLSYQFNTQVNINNFNTPLYEDSSNSNNLQIDYESDANSKAIIDIKLPDNDLNSEDSKKEKKIVEKKSNHKSSHRSRDSHKQSSSKDKKTDTKHSNSRDSSRHDKSKSSKDSKTKSSEKDKSKDKNEKKDSSRESSRHRSSHKSSHKDSKSHRSSSSSGRQSSKHSDEKKSSHSSSNHKDKTSDKSSSDKSKDSKSSSHKSDKDRKSSSSSRSDKTSSKSKNDKEKDKKSKKETDDHYSLSGRGNPNRRSTDRDSNDGSTSSKGSHHPSSSKSSNSKKDSKSSSKSESTSTSDSPSPSDKENIVREHSSKTKETLQHKPIVRIERHLEIAVASPPRLPFVPDVTIRKPKFAANLEEAKRLMKMRKFLDEEQKRMNQEAALLLEFQANVRPSMSQVYSNIPGPELEFACISNVRPLQEMLVPSNDNMNHIVLPEGHDVLNQEDNDINVLNQEHDDVNEVLPRDNNINNDVTREHDHSAITEENIDKAHYTNNELLTVLNDAKNDEVNNSVDFEVLIDSVNPNKTVTNTVTDKNIQGLAEIPEQNQEIDNTNVHVQILINENQNENNNAQSVENAPNFAVEETKLDNVDKEEINEPTDIIKQTETSEISIENNEISEEIENPPKQETKKKSDLFEITIITEELSESEEAPNDDTDTPKIDNNIVDEVKTQKQNIDITSELPQNEVNIDDSKINDENKLHYFGEHEKYNAELERAKFNSFFKEYNTKIGLNNKLYLINCDSYEENIVRECSKEFGDYEIVSYQKNGHLTLPINKNVIKNVNISTEISLPMDADYENTYESENITHNVFSPGKSECSFELSSDYDTKLQEMVNKTSRQEIMEIILGNVIDSSPSKMPKIDYLTDSNIDGEYESGLKRKNNEISEETTTSVNNNRPVLTPNKIRKLSTDQITSTTQENEEISNNKIQNITRSKFIGRARRVGLPRPKRTILPNSPSSDKSVENYEQNTPATPATPNGKLKRSKVQRYDTSDLYKPKLHYLSRRNQVT